MSYDYSTGFGANVGGSGRGFNLNLYAPIDPLNSQVIPGLDLINQPSTAQKSPEERPTTSSEPAAPASSNSTLPPVPLLNVKKEPVEPVDHEPNMGSSSSRGIQKTIQPDIKPDKARLQREMASAASTKVHSSASLDTEPREPIDSKMGIKKIHKTTSVDQDPKKIARELRRQQEMEVRRHIRNAPAYIPTPIPNMVPVKKEIQPVEAEKEKEPRKEAVVMKRVIKTEPPTAEEFRFNDSESDDEVITIRRKKKVGEEQEKESSPEPESATSPPPDPAPQPVIAGISTAPVMTTNKNIEAGPVGAAEESAKENPNDDADEDVIILSSDDDDNGTAYKSVPSTFTHSVERKNGRNTQKQIPPEEDWLLTRYGKMTREAYNNLLIERLRRLEKKHLKKGRRSVEEELGVAPEETEEEEHHEKMIPDVDSDTSYQESIPPREPEIERKRSSSTSDSPDVVKKVAIQKKKKNVVDRSSEESDKSIEVQKKNQKNKRKDAHTSKQVQKESGDRRNNKENIKNNKGTVQKKHKERRTPPVVLKQKNLEECRERSGKDGRSRRALEPYSDEEDKEETMKELTPPKRVRQRASAGRRTESQSTEDDESEKERVKKTEKHRRNHEPFVRNRSVFSTERSGSEDEEDEEEEAARRKARNMAKQKSKRKLEESSSSSSSEGGRSGNSLDDFIVDDDAEIEYESRKKKNKKNKKRRRDADSSDESFSLGEDDEDRIPKKKKNMKSKRKSSSPPPPPAPVVVERAKEQTTKKRCKTSQPGMSNRKVPVPPRPIQRSEEPKGSVNAKPTYAQLMKEKMEKAAERLRKREEKREHERLNGVKVATNVWPSHWGEENRFRGYKPDSARESRESVDAAPPSTQVRKRKTSSSIDEPSTSSKIDEIISSMESDDEPASSAPRRIAHANVQNRKPVDQPIRKKRATMEDQLGKSMKEAEERAKRLAAEKEKLKNKKYKTQEELYGEKSHRVGSNAKGTAREARPMNTGGAQKRVTVKQEPTDAAPVERKPPCPPVLQPNSMKISLKYRKNMIEKIFKDVYENDKANAAERAQQIELELMNSSKSNQTYKVKVMNKLREIRSQNGEAVIPVAKNGKYMLVVKVFAKIGFLTLEHHGLTIKIRKKTKVL